MEKGNPLYVRFDAWAVSDGLTEIMGCDSGGSHDGDSRYFGYFSSDELNALANDAGYLWTEFECLLQRLELNMPKRNVRFRFGDGDCLSGAFWFDTATALIEDSDIAAMLVEEEVIYCEDELCYGKKSAGDYRAMRLRMLEKLTREQTALITVGVLGFLTRYRELYLHRDMMLGIIDGLDFFHTPLVLRSGETLLHDSSWV